MSRRAHIARARAAAIAREHEAESFKELVEEYASMGYSRWAVARRLLGIDTTTMESYLDGATVEFKKKGDPGYQHWDDRLETASAIRDARVNNGTVRLLTMGGETLHLNEWARRTGILATTIARRIDHAGWTVEDALTTPSAAKNRGRRRKAPAKTPVTDQQRSAMERMWARSGSWQ